MKESHRKGLANYPDPESCVARRKATIEALTGAQAGRVLSCEISVRPECRRRQFAGRPHHALRYREWRVNSAQSETPACLDTPRARTGRSQDRPQDVEWAGWGRR
jgi:hypothetical protein